MTYEQYKDNPNSQDHKQYRYCNECGQIIPFDWGKVCSYCWQMDNERKAPNLFIDADPKATDALYAQMHEDLKGIAPE